VVSQHHPAVLGGGCRAAGGASGLQQADLWRDSTKLLEEMGVEMVYEEYYDEDGRLYQWETCIQPDVYVHMDIEDLRQGKDTVIEWVLAQ
jgi:hemerythrin superfamily protein